MLYMMRIIICQTLCSVFALKLILKIQNNVFWLIMPIVKNFFSLICSIFRYKVLLDTFPFWLCLFAIILANI